MPYDKFDNAVWNSFIGKKILLINPNATSVEVAVITGCDPDIGICLNDIGEVDPHTIILGPSAPECGGWDKLITEKRKEYLYEMFKQIQSGYFSYPEFDKIMQKYYKKSIHTVSGASVSWPYSM